jgi:hypothetical protein
VCAGTVALTVSLLCLAPPCRADDAANPRSTRHSIATLSPKTAALLANQSQPNSPGTADHASFFKTKKGAAVLVLLAAGFGYTLYSKSHDRVLSPVR